MGRLTLMVLVAALMGVVGCKGEGDSDNSGKVKAPAPSGDGSPRSLATAATAACIRPMAGSPADPETDRAGATA